MQGKSEGQVGGRAPVEVRAGLAGRQQVWLAILQLHQLHEEVSLCQAEQRVDHGKVWLIKLVSHLQRSHHLLVSSSIYKHLSVSVSITAKSGSSKSYCTCRTLMQSLAELSNDDSFAPARVHGSL